MHRENIQSQTSIRTLQVFVLGMLSCLLVSGCGDPNRSKLCGTWGIQTADTLLRRLGDADESPVFPDDGADAGDTEYQSPKMQIQFRSNGELITQTEMGRVTPVPKTGRWEMVSFNEATKTMSVNCNLGLQATQHEIKFMDENTIELIPPNMAGLNMKLKFQRMK